MSSNGKNDPLELFNLFQSLMDILKIAELRVP